MPESSSFERLVELIARLRDPVDGCPWDRAQTHLSLRPYLLEEAHEAISAIDEDDPEAMADELGDVLLQVVLHSQIASESGRFTIDDVVARISEKLTRRHPHVFEGASNDLPSIRSRWEEIKASENREQLPLPVLLKARKFVSLRATGGEIQWEAACLTEEAQLGVRLLRVILEGWESGLDPELALEKAMKYIARAEPEPKAG